MKTAQDHEDLIFFFGTDDQAAFWARIEALIKADECFEISCGFEKSRTRPHAGASVPVIEVDEVYYKVIPLSAGRVRISTQRRSSGSCYPEKAGEVTIDTLKVFIERCARLTPATTDWRFTVEGVSS